MRVFRKREREYWPLYLVPDTTPVAEASRFTIWKTRLRIMLGAFLNRRRVPGAVQPVEYDDALTGTHLRISTTPLFTVLEVNGRDYYFKRVSGRFDGTGSSI